MQLNLWIIKIGILIVFSNSYNAFAQTKTDTSTTNDTFYVKVMDSVVVVATRTSEQILAHKKLVRDIKKVMPYAKLTAYKLRLMEDHLNSLTNKKDKKRYINECEKNLKNLFKTQLKDLTIDQGKVLMKLVHRETGSTTWEIMKKYKGTFDALMWQSFGAVYGHNLKSEFDPVLDYQIEMIIKTEKLD